VNLVKVFVIYDSKYGNTKLAGEAILEGIRDVEGIESTICYIKEIDPGKLVEYDAIVLGGPNHMGRPSQTMKKFLDKLAGLDLKANNAAVFGTYSGRVRSPDRAVKKIEQILEEKLPNLKLMSPSLSLKVKGVTGPLVDVELPKCKDFGRKIANQL
jgi:flavorubredoxin